MPPIIEVLRTLRPGAHWTLQGDTYEGLTWLDDPATKPTREEVEAALEDLQNNN